MPDADKLVSLSPIVMLPKFHVAIVPARLMLDGAVATIPDLNVELEPEVKVSVPVLLNVVAPAILVELPEMEML